MVSNLKVSSKLLGAIGIVTVLASTAVGWFVFRSAERGLRQQVEMQLVAERNSRARLVSTYLQRFHDQLRISSKLPVTQFALRDMPGALRGRPAEYGRLQARLQTIACGWVSAFAIPDVLLVGLDGTVLFTCGNNADFATNLRSGRLQESGLGQAFSRAATAAEDTTVFVDYQPYEPLAGAPAAFAAVPVFDSDNGTRLGVLVFRVGVDEINSTMTDAAGFGSSGESYLLGPDLTMRTNSRFVQESTILKHTVTTTAGRRALSGESGTMEQDDYRGVRVLAAYAPLDVAGMRWAIIAEIDLAEALLPARMFRNQLLSLLAVVGLVGGFVMWETLRRVVLSPVAALSAGARRVAAHDYSQPVGLAGRDELGKLGDAFDGMMAAIGRDVDELRRTQAALEAAEAERQRLLTAAGVGLWRGDLASRVWTMDGRARAMLGLGRDAVVDTESWTRALHPDDRARAVSRLEEVKRAAAAYELEYRVVWPDGQVRHLLERGLSSGDPGEPPTHIDGIFYDVTALRSAEQRAQQLLEAAPDAMIVADAGGRVVLVNGAAERLFGYSRSELIGQSIDMLVPDSFGPVVTPQDARELWGRQKDGGQVPVEIGLSPLESADGRLIVAVVRDISDRRAAERSLRASEERLAAAAIGANLGLWDVNPEERGVVVNEILESQLGYPPLALRETDEKWSVLRGGLAAWIELLHPDDRNRVAGLIEGFLAGDAESYRAEQRVRRPDGTYTWILSVGNSAARDEHGRPLRVNGVHIDITGMKALQADLERRYEELERLQGLRDGLVHMIVHDLRSPLTSVMGYLDLLRSYPQAPASERDGFIAAAFDGGSQMAEMISSLLDINRLEAGEMPVERQSVNLCEVIAEAVRSMGGVTVGRRVSQTSPDGPVRAHCDPTLIRRVVANLLGNALKFTPSDGAITLAARMEDGQPRVEVTDTGAGIPADFLPRVFDKFSQAGAGRARKRYSTGLGLAFCKLAVEAHGGSIGVSSELGRGSHFWFCLPA